MNYQFTKQQRSFLRELAGKAHDRELHKLLGPIAEEFDAWRAGKKETRSVADALDKFSKERKSTSSPYRDPSLAHFMVARALVEGLLQENEVPTEIRSLLAGPITFYRETKARNSAATEKPNA